MTPFKKALAFGQAGESDIARWLRQRGNCVLAAPAVPKDSRKGPTLLTPTTELIVPDLLVMKGYQCYFIEVKHKTAFSLYRKGGRRWQTGIDLRHYADYLEVERELPWPVWLLFLHDGGQAKDSPPNSPRGLFGRSLAYLRSHEDHRDEKVGMVYWNIDQFLVLSTNLLLSTMKGETAQANKKPSSRESDAWQTDAMKRRFGGDH